MILEIAGDLPKIGEVLSEVDEVRPQRVETRGRRLAEVTYLSSDFPEIVLAHSGEFTGATGIEVPGAIGSVDNS